MHLRYVNITLSLKNPFQDVLSSSNDKSSAFSGDLMMLESILLELQQGQGLLIKLLKLNFHSY